MSWEEILKEDERFADMVRLLDSMTRRGKEALERNASNDHDSGKYYSKKSGPKVLNHFEVPMQDDDPSFDIEDDGASTPILSEPRDSLKTSRLNGSGTAQSASSKSSATNHSTVEPDSEEDDERYARSDPNQADVSNETNSSINQSDMSGCNSSSSEMTSSFESSRNSNDSAVGGLHSEYSISID